MISKVIFYKEHKIQILNIFYLHCIDNELKKYAINL